MATYDQSGNEIAAGANPLPGRFVIETREDGSAVMVLGLNPGDSANSIAAFYTIGGNAYGQAIANYNGWEWPAGDYAASHGARLAIIPAEWLKPSYTAKYGIFQGAADTVSASVETVKDAAGSAIETVTGGVKSALEGAGALGKWIVIGLVALAVIEVMSHVPRSAASTRRRSTYRRRAARAIYSRMRA